MLIGARTFGQLVDSNNTKYNCYSELKLKYLNANKQTILMHHKIKSQSRQD